jgi:hypothetical protein
MRIFYRLASGQVGDLWSAVRDVAVSQVAEVNQLAGEYLGERDGVEHVSAECRGPYCVYADDAVRLLQARGHKARRFGRRLSRE